MASYYYAIASLPALKNEGEQALTYDGFLEMVKPGVPKGVYAQLEELTLSSEDSPLMRSWAEFYRGFAEEMRYQRNKRRGQAAQVPKERDSAVVSAVSNLLSIPDPLDAERAILKIEFDAIDRLIGMHYFDSWALFGYALKLKLLERLNIFDKEAGEKEFRRLADGIRSEIHRM